MDKVQNPSNPKTNEMYFILVLQPVRHCRGDFRVRKLNAPHCWQLNCQALSHFSRAHLVFEFVFIDRVNLCLLTTKFSLQVAY